MERLHYFPSKANYYFRFLQLRVKCWIVSFVVDCCDDYDDYCDDLLPNTVVIRLQNIALQIVVPPLCCTPLHCVVDVAAVVIEFVVVVTEKEGCIVSGWSINDGPPSSSKIIAFFAFPYIFWCKIRPIKTF